MNVTDMIRVYPDPVLRQPTEPVTVFDETLRRLLYHLINPEVIASSGGQTGEEGCLSFPGIFGQVKRPLKVTVRCQDGDGNLQEYTAQGFIARAFTHEIDHLNGRLLIDNFSPLKRNLVLKKMGLA